jgi:hypothetical protein
MLTFSVDQTLFNERNLFCIIVYWLVYVSKGKIDI